MIDVADCTCRSKARRHCEGDLYPAGHGDPTSASPSDCMQRSCARATEPRSGDLPLSDGKRENR